MAKGAPLGARITPELKDALAKAAKDDMRSMTGMLEKILTEWLREHGYLNGARKK